MALGVQGTPKGRLAIVRLVEAAIASAAAPSALGDGVAVSDLTSQFDPENECTLLCYTTAGAGVITCAYIRPRGLVLEQVAAAGPNKWFPLGTGTDADKGKLNELIAQGEVDANQLLHAERLFGILDYDRLGCELGAIAGDGTQRVNVDLVFRARRRR